uniref:DNA-directed DNA polymerase n=1 Tax=Homalodisca liturata TaxID=320908 RepID=A0A1B6J8T5_9HEMI
MFSLRIVNVDHYMSPPKSGLDLTYSQFRGNQIKSVPVVRIFGSTPSGCKTCLHIHGVFPYILVPYSGTGDAGRAMYQLASSLDKAINVSTGSSYSKKQHVFKIVQVSGRPFYGFHSQDHQFLKIFFYNPLVVKRACDLLQNGAICGTQFQIHEGHVPFILQFFIDYNLYGMSFINLKSVIPRKDAAAPDLTPGSLTKESFCEFEADAMAVDILNRLTVEGELAVNPGLAAIWEEEKERLQKDALDSSQRPTPQRTMSEVLLMEKLKDNLRFQGTCRVQLRETIPYPAVTQRSTGSEILDASVLDTHSLTSLVPQNSTREEVAVIDEELVLSLTEQSFLSNSMDHSMMLALDTLAAQNENMDKVVSQNVDDDSILGSQMLPEETRCDGSALVEKEEEGVEYTLPFELSSDNDSLEENDHNSDDNFDTNIPQLDGIGDIFEENKKSDTQKRGACKKKRKVLIENINENSVPFDNDEVLGNNMKHSDCWPGSVKSECMDEVFTDDNNPLSNFSEYSNAPNDSINIDFVPSFDAVLRGDPSLTYGQVASSEDTFLQTAENSFTSDLSSMFGKDQLYVAVNKLDVCLNSVPSLNNNVESAYATDKAMSVLSLSDEFLNTSHLDEMFNDDLNKGLDIICERNSQLEIEESDYEESEIKTEIERFESVQCEDNMDNTSEATEKTSPEEIEFVEVNTTPIKVEVKEGKNVNDIDMKVESDKDSASINTPTKTDNNKLKEKRSFKYSPQKKRLYVKILKVIKRNVNKNNRLFEMSRCEIERYFEQLEFIATKLKNRDPNSLDRVILTPIREIKIHENETTQKKKRKNARPSKLVKLIKQYNSCLSMKEIQRLISCYVKLNKLPLENYEFSCSKYNNTSTVSQRKKKSRKGLPRKEHQLNVKQDSHDKAKKNGAYIDSDQNGGDCCQPSLRKLNSKSNKYNRRVQDIGKTSLGSPVKLEYIKKASACNKTCNMKNKSKLEISKKDKNLDKICSKVKRLRKNQSNTQNETVPSIIQSFNDGKDLSTETLSPGKLKSEIIKNNLIFSNSSGKADLEKETGVKSVKSEVISSEKSDSHSAPSIKMENLICSKPVVMLHKDCGLLKNVKQSKHRSEGNGMSNTSKSNKNTELQINSPGIKLLSEEIPIEASRDIVNIKEVSNEISQEITNNVASREILHLNNIDNEDSSSCNSRVTRLAVKDNDLFKTGKLQNENERHFGCRETPEGDISKSKHSVYKKPVKTKGKIKSTTETKSSQISLVKDQFNSKYKKRKSINKANQKEKDRRTEKNEIELTENTSNVQSDNCYQTVSLKNQSLISSNNRDSLNSKKTENNLYLKPVVVLDKDATNIITSHKVLCTNSESVKSSVSKGASSSHKIGGTRVSVKDNDSLIKTSKLRKEKKNHCGCRFIPTESINNCNKNLVGNEQETNAEGMKSTIESKSSKIASVRHQCSKKSKKPKFGDKESLKEEDKRGVEENEMKLIENENISIVDSDKCYKNVPLKNNLLLSSATEEKTEHNLDLKPVVLLGKDTAFEVLNAPSATQKENRDQNVSSRVCMEKISSVSNIMSECNVKSDYAVSSYSQLKTNKGRKRSSSLEFAKPPVKLLRNSINTHRRRSLRVYSLDGTVDSSSSDESESNRIEVSQVAALSTPNRKRHAKNNRSPKTSYVPLNIEIKRSPKVNIKQKAESNFLDNVPKFDLQSKLIPKEDKNLAKEISSNKINEGLTEKEMSLKPFIKLQKVSLPLELPLPSTSGSNFSCKNESSMVTGEMANNDLKQNAVHPLVKRLKVSIRRLSEDTLGDSAASGELNRLEKRSHRSLSLPITEK